MPLVHIAQRLKHALDGSRARCGPEQACPPGSHAMIARQARRERLDADGPAPGFDELLQPNVILAGLQRVRIVGRSASLRQRGEQNEASDTIGTIRGKFDDASPPSDAPNCTTRRNCNPSLAWRLRPCG